MRSPRFLIPLLVLALSGAGCATKPAATATMPAAVEPQRWVRTELYFALGDWTETALSTEPESRWAAFLDAEVTPRFPDGLSVIDVYGQWRDAKPGALIKRERSRLLVIVHADTPEVSAKIEAIRAAWKRAAGEQSVLRVTQPADVRF